MRRITIISTMLILAITACIDAPRDNKYDPQNPDRAYLSAYVYELGSYPVEYAIVVLMQDSMAVRSDTSNFEGIVEFEEIIPGIYDIHAEALYYSAVDYPSESLWAGIYSESLRIEFNTLPFEDEAQGTHSPHGFEVLNGAWMITEDIQQPEVHSVPQVYGSSVSTANDTAIALCQTEAENFLIKAHIKIDTSSVDSWRAGIVMRFRDLNNYYTVTLSPDSVYCDLVFNGQKTNIHARAHEAIPGIWQELCVERPYDWIFMRIILNGAIIYSIYDNVLSGGSMGLIACNGEEPGATTVHFDDVTLDLTYGLPE
jgi:hypothetical protein